MEDSILKFENHQYHNCKITLEDGQHFLVSANWLHNQNLDYWKDWTCDAGHRRLFVDEKFDVYSGECLNDYLGNLQTKWRLLSQSATCRRDRCTGCTDDLMIKKQDNTVS